MKLFYFVNQFSAFQECLCIIHCDQSHLFQSFFCQECLVTGDNNLIACQQSGQSLVMFFQVASVFEEVFMFFFCKRPYLRHGICQLQLLSARASESTRPPRATLMKITPSFTLAIASLSIMCLVAGIRGQWMEITSARAYSSSRVTYSRPRLGLGNASVSDDIHAEAFQDIDHALTDFTCTDDTCCFAIQSDTCQTSDIEVEFCCSFIGQMRLSVNSHQKRCALFCYGLRRVSGYSQYGQTTFFCNIQINAVETCATQQQNLDTQIFQFTDNFCGNFVINERASTS